MSQLEFFAPQRVREPCNCGAMNTWSSKKGWARSHQLASSGPDRGIHRWGKGEECWVR